MRYLVLAILAPSLFMLLKPKRLRERVEPVQVSKQKGPGKYTPTITGTVAGSTQNGHRNKAID